MSRVLIATLLLLMIVMPISPALAQQDAPSPLPSEIKIVGLPDTGIRVIEMPEDKGSHDLVFVTWIVVAANALLCGVTWLAAYYQRKDMRDSISVSRKVADAAGLSADASVRSSDAANASVNIAAQQKRDMLERETNIAAHRVSAIATRLSELVTRLTFICEGVFVDFSSTEKKIGLDRIDRYRTQAHANAQAMLDATLHAMTNSRLAEDLRKLDGHLVQLEAYKEQVLDDLAEVLRRVPDKQYAATGR